MAGHAWVLENVASYLADGLDPAERERLEQHVASCPQCTEAVQQARALDDTLQELFAGVRPGPALEDRMIQALRKAARPRWRRLPVYPKLALGTAAVLLLGLFGAFIADTIEQGGLSFPGTSLSKQTLLAANSSLSFWGGTETPALTTLKLSGSIAALQDADALASQTREEAVAAFEEIETRDLRPRFDTYVSGDGSTHTPERTTEFQIRTIRGALRDGSTHTPERTTVWSKDNSRHRTDSNTDGGIVADTRRWGFSAVDPNATSTDYLYYYDGKNAGHLPGDGDNGGGDNGGWGKFDGENTIAAGETARPEDRSLTIAENFDRKVEVYHNFVSKLPASQTVVASAPVSVATLVAVPSHFKPNDLRVSLEKAPVASRKPIVVFTGPQRGQKATYTMALQAAERETEGIQANQDQPATVVQRKVIRSGEMKFEVDSFDSAVEKIIKITAEESGLIATVDSEQLPNGKMRGSVVVRVPPERLDTLVLKLRALGELKSQKIGSQDVTKKYTDLESRLRAARAMEERLLEMIKNGKGEIEHLLLAEKELGVWRTKIEEIEGELRYYNNVIALSTLTIGLAEKEIRAAAALTETERVQMGIEVEDVEQAHREALQAVDEADGLVTKSELKQHAAEQFSAIIHFEVARDAAGPLRDRLRQIGHVARLEIDRVQQAEAGSDRPRDARTVVRKDTQFVVSLYNVANVAPRETIHVNLVCTDTEAAYKTILERVQQAGGRVVTSSLKSQHSQKTIGSVQFEVPVAVADEVLTDVKAAGEVMRLEVTENPDSQNVTKSKRGFNVQLWAMGLVAPRKTIVLQVATDDVPAGYRMLQEAVRKAKGRILNAQLNEQDKQNITAALDFDIPRDDQPALSAVLDTVGEVFSRNVTRSQDDENVIDSKVRLQVALINQAGIPPRETITLGIEVGDVDQVTTALTMLVAESKGRTVESHLAHERSGRVTAKVVFDVPLASASALVESFKASGTVRAQQSTRNPQVPDGKLAIARLDVTLSNAELIVPRDGGLWAQIRTGLATSFTAISWSLIVVIVGLCFVLPWAIVLYIAYRVIAWIRRKASPASTTA